ncbi:hypothetical protein Tco_0705453 [Tanacetum coccineum]|uniref:Phospholipase-like protein n=1 Tax=Tanacetum coccineum TaxID=301880 RepID=A0ABQ4Y6N5_9ASTR
MTENPFRNRIFPHIEAKKSVKLLDVIAIFDKMRDRSLVLEDSAAVKICLLVLLQHGFLGHLMSHKISNEMLMLLEHLSNCWNIFPWGSYIWDHTYPKLRDALGKRKVSHNDKRDKGEEIRYTVTGFVYAFMIWILEAIPATHVYVCKDPTNKITRALAWKTILSLLVEMSYFVQPDFTLDVVGIKICDGKSDGQSRQLCPALKHHVHDFGVVTSPLDLKRLRLRGLPGGRLSITGGRTVIRPFGFSHYEGCPTSYITSLYEALQTLLLKHENAN